MNPQPPPIPLFTCEVQCCCCQRSLGRKPCGQRMQGSVTHGICQPLCAKALALGYGSFEKMRKVTA